ncbi:C protein [Bat paramyxovirus]|uniref:C protein n=1 Tax=bat paramyxovirus 17770 TaxID=3070195 RepID=A0AA48F9C8_9MONO|nr:C protein [Bat paramyxovirus]AYM47546.1 C protein [bat paramyxovirus 17770]
MLRALTMVSRLLSLFKRIDRTSVLRAEGLESQKETSTLPLLERKVIRRNPLKVISDKRGNSRALLSQQKVKALKIMDLVMIMKEQSMESDSMKASLLDQEMTMLDMFETLLIQLVENNLKLHKTYLMMKEDHFLTLREKKNLKKAMNMLVIILNMMEGMTDQEIIKTLRQTIKDHDQNPILALG